MRLYILQNATKQTDITFTFTNKRANCDQQNSCVQRFDTIDYSVITWMHNWSSHRSGHKSSLEFFKSFLLYFCGELIKATT